MNQVRRHMHMISWHPGRRQYATGSCKQKRNVKWILIKCGCHSFSANFHTIKLCSHVRLCLRDSHLAGYVDFLLALFMSVKRICMTHSYRDHKNLPLNKNGRIYRDSHEYNPTSTIQNIQIPEIHWNISILQVISMVKGISATPAYPLQPSSIDC